MLAGIDQIDWSQLSHAYGPATDVPELIRGLADESSEIRDASLGELLATIWHQGNVFEATAYAVPFLIELATDPAVPDRSHVLVLLQTIAEGWLDRQKKHAVLPGKFFSAEAARRHAVESRHDQAAHAAVAKGLTALSKLLTDDEPQVRVFTAFLLALLTEHAAEVAEKILAAADLESDDRFRSMLQFALVRLAQNTANPDLTDVVVRQLTSVFDETPSEVVALGTGIALLEMEQEVVISRVRGLARPRLVSDCHIFQSIEWPGSTLLYWHVYGCLNFRPREQLKWIVEGLSHTDRDVRDSAIGCGDCLCEKFRWASGEIVPVLARLIDRVDADEQKRAVQLMCNMGRAGVARLETFKERLVTDVRDHAAIQLKRIEATRNDRESRLVEKRPVPLPSVAALVEVLEAHQGSRKWHNEPLCDAVIQLGFHGQPAQSAVELLLPLARHENPWMRAHCIRAIWRISQNPSMVVPLLEANLDPEPAVFLVLDCLQQIGPAAGTVIAKLRGMLDSERRFFAQGSSDSCEIDEAFCDACAAAIQAIETRI